MCVYTSLYIQVFPHFVCWESLETVTSQLQWAHLVQRSFFLNTILQSKTLWEMANFPGRQKKKHKVNLDYLVMLENKKLFKNIKTWSMSKSTNSTWKSSQWPKLELFEDKQKPHMDYSDPSKNKYLLIRTDINK